MPSRLLPPPAPPHHHHHSDQNLIAPLVAAAVSFSLLLVIAFLYRKLTLSRTAPAPFSTPERDTVGKEKAVAVVVPPPPEKELRRFKFSQLKKWTAAFSVSNRLGQGGFGSVYRAVVPTTGELFAVKLMDAAGSIQGEREFHNEIALATRVISATAAAGSPHLVSVVGYSTTERRCRRREDHERKAIVYELMSKGSLQEKLLDNKCAELCIWENRLKIIIHVAKALQFLHFSCGNTAVVHGDVKPSNVLLDDEFNAKLGDFGLAKILDDNEDEKIDEARVLLEIDDDSNNNNNNCNEDEIEESCGCNNANNSNNNNNNDVGSIAEEESVSVSVVTAEQSPMAAEVAMTVSASPSDGFERASSLAESWGDKMSVEGGKKKGWGSGRDYWWWKQGGEDSSSGRVKDYVMEWIGSEIKKERPKSSDLVPPTTNSINCNDVGDNNHGCSSSSCNNNNTPKIELKKKKKKRLDWWWASLDEEDKLRKKGRKPREWWREEFCEELSKKNKKKPNSKSKSSIGSELWWQRDEEFVAPERKKRRKSKSSFGSIDWWLDGLSGELRSGGGICRRNSQDWGANGGDVIPKSGGISSTPSMRGTVCYIAPEYGGGGQLSEKCDVYSFGVLVLVVISGRRPLQVLASPMSEFERANLVSWARQLAYNGKLLDLVDTTIESLDKEQAMLCITIALLCLQRLPGKRPNMKEIVEMLTGEAEPPHLPFEFSPSPPSNFPFKSRKKGR